MKIAPNVSAVAVVVAWRRLHPIQVGENYLVSRDDFEGLADALVTHDLARQQARKSLDARLDYEDPLEEWPE